MITAIKIKTAIVFGALAGCAAHGPKYPEVIDQIAPLTADHVRIVFLRPNDRYDDYSLSKAVIRVNGEKLGNLAYGGFLLVDVAAGDVTVMASTSNPLRNPLVGSCKLQLRIVPGSTAYFDVAPRTGSVVAGVAGAVAGAAIAGGGSSTYGMDEVGKAIVGAGAEDAAASATVTIIAQTAESAGKSCGGAFGLMHLDPQDALPRLDNLSWSK